MKSEKIESLLRKYFVYSGLKEKFGSIDFAPQLKSILKQIKSTPHEEESKKLKGMLKAVASWDGEFDSLVLVEWALEDLTAKLLPFSWAQGPILKNWPEFCKLTGRAVSNQFSRGVCGALTRLSELSLVLTTEELERFPSHVRSRLVDFEAYLRRMATWDGQNIEEVKEDFEIFEQFVLPIQADLCNWQSALEGFPLDIELPFALSFVHNRESLAYFFKRVLQPGKVIFLGASDHAARIFVTQDDEIVYYNPNERYGFLTFHLEKIEYFLSKLAQGFRDVSVDKFSLTVDTCDAQGFRSYPLEFKALFNELLNIQTCGGRMPIKQVINRQGSNGETALYMACYANNCEQVTLLLQLGADPNLCEVRRTMPLHIAAMRGNLDITKLLLGVQNIKIDFLDKKGYTPLRWALAVNSFSVAKSLFMAGADITHLRMRTRWKLFDYLVSQEDAVDRNVYLVLFEQALKADHLEGDLKDKIFLSFLEKIIREDNAQVLKILIKHKPEIMCLPFSLSDQECEGQEEVKRDNELMGSILHLALDYGSVKVIKCLLKFNPGLSKKVDSDGLSASEWVANWDKTEENKAILDLFDRHENSSPATSKLSLFAPDQEVRPERAPPSLFPYCTLF